MGISQIGAVHLDQTRLGRDERLGAGPLAVRDR